MNGASGMASVSMRVGSDGGDRGLLEPGWRDLQRWRVQLIVVNAAHIKAVPGRKDGMKEGSTWLADLRL